MSGLSKKYTNKDAITVYNMHQGWEHIGFQCPVPDVFNDFVAALKTLNRGW